MHVDQARIERFNNKWLDVWEPDNSPYQEVITHYFPSKSVASLEPKRVSTRRLEPRTPFLLKLHEMLDNVERTGNQHIVSWLPHGRAFKVYRQQSFVKKIIPYYFNQSKYKSFQRQLHLYEFTRTQRGPEAGAYSHPNFIRGVPSLCLSMSPVKIKSKFKEQINLESLRGQEHQYPTMPALLYPSKTSITPPSPRLTSKPTHDDDPSEFMKKIEAMLVTGPAFAKQLEVKSRTKELVPHDGDVVYIFGGMPFHDVERSS
jgi:hypothetical protein